MQNKFLCTDGALMDSIPELTALWWWTRCFPLITYFMKELWCLITWKMLWNLQLPGTMDMIIILINWILYFSPTQISWCLEIFAWWKTTWLDTYYCNRMIITAIVILETNEYKKSDLLQKRRDCFKPSHIATIRNSWFIFSAVLWMWASKGLPTYRHVLWDMLYVNALHNICQLVSNV